MKIIKRSGMEVEFDRSKIIAAVKRANNSVVEAEKVSDEQVEKIAENVETICDGMNRALNVEEIQDLVENQIMNQKAFRLASNYITYRYKRALVRKSNSTDKQILSEFISGGNYKRYTNGYSNLSYAIADLNADSVPELLIESKTEASGFYVTWVFTLDKNKNVVPVKVEDSELVLEEYASYGYGQFRYSQKYKAVIVSTTFRSNSNLGDIPFYKLQGTSLKHSFNIVWDKWDNPSNYRYDSNGNKTEITKSEIEVYKQELIDFSWTQFGSWTKSYSETDESQPVVQSANESENQNESPVVIPEETQGDEQNGEQNLEQDENKEVEQDTKVEQDAEIQEDEEIQADEEISEQPSEESQSAETQKTEEQVDE